MKGHARYIRISSLDQNTARQEAKKFNGRSYIDKCSGSIPLAERPDGKRLYNDIKTGEVNYLEVVSIDRLGRDADDIQATIKFLKDNKCQLVVTEFGLMLFNNEGEVNNMFKLITDLLANIAQMNRENILYTQKQGIEAAKARGVYSGRRKGAIEDHEKFLKKYKQIVEIIRHSNGKLSANAISKMVIVDGKPLATPPTVRKVMRMLEESEVV